jgi:hypothetical protein
MLHAAAKAAHRETRIVERVRPICAHNGFANADVHRLVRLQYWATSTQEEAVHAVVALCRGVSGVEEGSPLVRAGEQ